MKLYTKFPKPLLAPFKTELNSYETSLTTGDLSAAWYHLERAHIIGQSYPLPHTKIHWLMLKFGFSIKNRKEILGQIPRLLVSGIKSFVGVIPA